MRSLEDFYGFVWDAHAENVKFREVDGSFG